MNTTQFYIKSVYILKKILFLIEKKYLMIYFTFLVLKCFLNCYNTFFFKMQENLPKNLRFIAWKWGDDS